MAEDPKKPPAPPAPAPPAAPIRPPSQYEMPRAATGQARVNAAAVKAKIAFQGDDEFSVASLDPETWRAPVRLKGEQSREAQPERPPEPEPPRQEEGNFVWKAFRRVFGR
jgi:hypothetical protein